MEDQVVLQKWNDGPPSQEWIDEHLEEEIKKLLLVDKVKRFVPLVKSVVRNEDEFYAGCKLCPSQLLLWALEWRAIKCAVSLVRGEIGETVDLHGGLFPLHCAANLLLPDFTELFLQMGIQADLRCNDDEHEFNGLLPLNVALESLSREIFWTPKQSVFKLVTKLFEDKMKGAVDTVRLLADTTPDVKQVIYHYAEEGKLVELAALLMTARKEVMSTLTYESDNGCRFDGSMALRRCVAIEIASLIDEEYRLMGCRNHEMVQMCKEKKRVMMSEMLLLEIFQRKGHTMEDYMRFRDDITINEDGLVKKVACLLKHSNFPLSDEDAYYLEEKGSFWFLHELEWKWLVFPDDKYIQRLGYSHKRAVTKHAQCSSWPVALCLPSYLRSHSNINRKTDIRCKNHGFLPLHVELERLSSGKKIIKWTPRQSIFKLIIILCLPNMKEALETIRLLALNTEEIKEVIHYYAKEGGLIELAVLLIVAKEKVMDSILFPCKDSYASKICTTFRQCVKSELGALIDYEYRLMGRKEEEKLIQMCDDRKEVMMSILLLLEIFERAGDAIGAYVQSDRTNAPKEQVAQELASLFAEAGFILSSEDTDLSDIVDTRSCPVELVLEKSSNSVHGEEKECRIHTRFFNCFCFPNAEEPTESGYQKQGIHVPPYSQPSSFSDENRGMPYGHWWLIRARLPRESSVLRSALQPLHVPWTPKASFCSGFPKPVERHCVRNFMSNKRWASLVLAVKRSTRGI